MGRRVSVGSVSVGSVARAVEWSVPSRRVQARQRLVALVGAVGGDDASGLSTRELVSRAAAYLAEPTPAKLWFTLAVLHARLPREDDVIEFTRLARLDGGLSSIARMFGATSMSRFLPAFSRRRVEVVESGVLVDVDHTSTVEFATGIQRVARETLNRWVRDHDPILVGWTGDRSALRRLTASERATALGGAPVVTSERKPKTVVVPYGAAYLLPELNINRSATRRLAALARWSPGSSGVIGFDTVPLSSPETTDAGMPAAFADNLIAVRRMDYVAAISGAAAHEYLAWTRMLTSTGIPGPRVISVPLGHDHGETTGKREDSTSPVEPLVLCVGSHEPRKNHLAVLQAAELLWQEGVSFRLLFVGGNAWHSEAFLRRVDELAARERSVTTRMAVSDEELDDLYRTARFTVFPSLNEGYGLPIVESLRRGVPVITSNYGSMREIASHGGALFVDPRDDDEIAAAMRTLLVDDDELLRLATATRNLPLRTWDDYAADVWKLATS